MTSTSGGPAQPTSTTGGTSKISSTTGGAMSTTQTADDADVETTQLPAGCYDANRDYIPDCTCNEVCYNCGYDSWPTDVFSCISCADGSEVQAVYTDGTGYCEG